MEQPLGLDWDAGPCRAQLRSVLPDAELEIVARTDSTNTRLLERARAGDAAPCLLVAEQQTAGRGRNGRDWLSRPGDSLTFSLALALAPASWSGLSLAVGAALADALDPAAGAAPRLWLKWPNDLWLADAGGGWRKLGGILIETLTAPAGPRVAVVGVGLNVRPQPAEGLASGYACLAEVDPAANAPAVLRRVAAPLAAALRHFEQAGFAPFAAAYGARDLLRGRPVVTTLPEVPEGVAQGVDADGALLVRTGGRLARLASGEVSVRPIREAT